ncbi:MAG: thioredoxin family protein [Elainellaceae cyanobacterium]
MSSVVQITDADFEKEVMEASETVLVYFWAPWCGPCRLMAPVMDWASSTYDDLKVVKLEVDPNPESVARCNVQGVPAILMFKTGEEIESVEGAISKQRLTDLLDSHLSPAV